MSLALVPHAAPSDRLYIWVGVADFDAAPALAWKLDGQSVAPQARRPLAPVLTTPADTKVFSGFFEFAGLAPDSVHRIELAVAEERIARTVRTLPASIPDGPQDRFDVLLVSCFHRLEDKAGIAGRVLSQMKIKPQLTLFAGDQVYLDLPTLQSFKDDEAWLGNKFQKDYLDNWFGNRQTSADPAAVPPGFPAVLMLAPGAFMPDDHEYWNNYPFAATVVENSWSAGGRKSWKAAAEAAYRGFQQPVVEAAGATRTIDVDPLSIMMLDTRSQRADGSRDRKGDLLGPAGRKALASWVDGLVQRPAPSRFPMLVTGQSFFREAAGAQGAVVDYEFPDYRPDYDFMIAQIERLSSAGLPVLLATGDVHWGRVLEAVGPPGSGPIYEVISSPTSLVTSVGVDQAKEVWGTITGFFGKRDPWPRHAESGKPPERFGSKRQYTTKVLASLRGNQASILRFMRAGEGLDLEVIGYPLSDDDTFNAAEQRSVRRKLSLAATA